jgi:uncharacterized membrane protein YfcA
MPEAANTVATIKDRSTGLTIFGSLQIAFGALCACFIPLALLPLAPAFRRQIEQTQGAPPDARGIVFGVAFYAMAAIFFVGTGIGAILKRRWIRPILLSVAWIWLVGGVLGAIVGSLILRRILSTALAKSPGLPPGAGWIVGIAVAGLVAIFYVVLPLSLLLFYRSPHVRATLEARDPRPRWTDACPLPVFAMSLYLGLCALATLVAGLFGVFPVFTVLLTGPSAVAIASGLAVLNGYFAWAAYRLRAIGWWGPLIAFTVTTASAAVYFARGDMTEYLAAAGLHGEQSRMLADSGLFGGDLMVVACSAWLAVLVGYLVWVRKYFIAPAARAGA